ncbi:MAG: hypothetical protein IT357_04030 [Gemmatimonadaceae bacterium]|nr:hypothetical protein [Gemmatimonadaceae bacterium]
MNRFIPPDFADELLRFAAYADKEARGDLALGFIRDEDDYTSHFAGALRRNVNAHTALGLRASSYVLPQGLERRTGCDGAIIVTHSGFSKVALFEAKWPRVSDSGYAWDYAQTSTGLSHYSDQLSRQKRLRPEFAVFEMFYNEHSFGEQPPYMHDELSSCVWRDWAATYDAARPNLNSPWTQGDLKALLGAHPVTSITEVLADLCECRAGAPIRSFGNTATFAGEFGIDGIVLEIQVPDTVSPRRAP